MSTPEQHAKAHANASSLGKLLAEVLNLHAPVGAEISTARTRQEVDDWLEGLERHQVGFIAPFLTQVLEDSNPPEAVQALLREAIDPSAQFSTPLVSIFLYGIISTVIGASVSPFIVGVSNDLSQKAVAAGIDRPVDPAIVSTAVGRGLTPAVVPTVDVPQWAYDEAAKSGIGKFGVDMAASIVGLPPAMQELFEMYRRGIIASETLGAPSVNSGQTVAVDHSGKQLTIEQGLREGDFRDDWIAAAARLAHAWPTPTDFVRAAVQAQMTYDEAKAWANATGLDTSTQLPLQVGDTFLTPDMFGLLVAVNGRPPGPQELAHMVHRGIIPQEGTGAGATTFQQGIAESDVKTKWTDELFALSVYVPPPEAVGTLLEHGVITADQAAVYWAANGVPNDVVIALTEMATQQHVGQEKLLVKRDITTAYYDGILPQAQAVEALGLLGYHGEVAAEIIATIDYRRQIRAIDSVVRRISTLYSEYKLSAVDALARMEAVGVTPAQANELVATWDQIRIAPVRLPTVSEIGAAVKYGTIDEATGIAELTALGYQPRDAAIVLSAHAEAQVTPLPAAGSTVTG